MSALSPTLAHSVSLLRSLVVLSQFKETAFPCPQCLLLSPCPVTASSPEGHQAWADRWLLSPSSPRRSYIRLISKSCWLNFNIPSVHLLLSTPTSEGVSRLLAEPEGSVSAAVWGFTFSQNPRELSRSLSLISPVHVAFCARPHCFPLSLRTQPVSASGPLHMQSSATSPVTGGCSSSSRLQETVSEDPSHAISARCPPLQD